MRSVSTFGLAAIIAVASATDSTTTPCGNLCANGAAPSRYITTLNGKQFAVCDSTDFVGFDPTDGSGTISNIDTAEALAEKCSTTAACVAGTAHNGYGYLKDAAPLPNGDASDTAVSVFQVLCPPSSSTTTTTAAVTTTTSTTAVVTTPATTTPVAPPPATTTSSSTTSATPIATPPAKCPPSSQIVTSRNGQRSTYAYGLFYAGSGRRNSYAWKTYETYPIGLSYQSAIQRCADFVTKQLPGVAQTFQVFQYGWDNTWHCDSSASANTDSNFVPTEKIGKMFQFNAISNKCPGCNKKRHSVDTLERVVRK